MKSFEREIRKRMWLHFTFCILGGIAVIIAIVLKLIQSDSAQTMDGFSVSVLIGIFGGFEAFSIPPIIRYRKALKDHEQLKNLHIEENDERNKMIELKICRTCFYATLTLLGYGGLFAVMFSRVVFYTLGSVLIVLCILYVIVKIIYSRGN